MTTRLAYIGVILIWATTPLAIQWSGEGVGFRFGVTARMLIGIIATLLVLVIMKADLPRNRKAIKTYLAGGLGIFSAMSCVYWAAQFIPSGWVSIVFGLSPLITGVLAALLLNEDSLAVHKLLGIGLGFIGLLITFGQGLNLGEAGLLGITGVLLGTAMHCLSAVAIKRIDAKLSGVTVTFGSLLVAVPLYLATWFATGSSLPETIGLRAGLSILYLGTVGTAIGFVLYYYVLKHMEVSRVSLITLITPICAIALGHWLNDELVTRAILLGTGCIVAGLFCYEFGQPLRKRLLRQIKP